MVHLVPRTVTLDDSLLGPKTRRRLINSAVGKRNSNSNANAGSRYACNDKTQRPSPPTFFDAKTGIIFALMEKSELKCSN